MQVDHPRAACGLMQPVHILRYELLGFAARLQPGQGAMRIVGQGLVEARPAEQAARPIASLSYFVADEGLETSPAAGASTGPPRRDIGNA